MQPTTLLDNLNSDLFAALSALSPKGSAQRVLVYVESDEDIAFWRDILTPFEANGISFDIQLPFKQGLEKGKGAALEKSQALINIGGVGTHFIICVDSDYDYLLQNTTHISTKVNTSDFIFQTYTYSIENLLCYSGSLRAVCVQSSKNDHEIFDFDELTKLYSKIIYKLFLWSFHFSLQHDQIWFTISKFCDEIKILENARVEERFSTAFQGLENRVKAKIQELESRFPTAIPHVEALSEKLKPLGVNEDNTYLFAQGHTIKDNVILMFLKPIFSHLKKEKEDEIKAKAKHNEELLNQLALYKNQVIPIDNVLNTNTAFKSCFLYQKLHADLTRYIERFKEAQIV